MEQIKIEKIDRAENSTSEMNIENVKMEEIQAEEPKPPLTHFDRLEEKVFQKILGELVPFYLKSFWV